MDVLSFAKRNSIGVVTGSDMHWPNPVSAWTVLKPSEFTEEAIIEEIRNQRTSFIVGDEITPAGAGDYVEANYGVSSKPWIYFGDFLKSFRKRAGFCNDEIIYHDEIQAAVS